MNKNNGDIRGVAVSLADHFSGGAELFGGTGNRGSRAKATEFKLEHCGCFTARESDRIQLAESATAAKLVPMFGILISNNAVLPQLKVAGKDGADTKLRGEADDGEGGRLDSFFPRALAFLSAAEGKTFRPAEVVVVVVADEADLSVIGKFGSGLGMGV
jgi:hypothetical protein